MRIRRSPRPPRLQRRRSRSNEPTGQPPDAPPQPGGRRRDAPPAGGGQPRCTRPSAAIAGTRCRPSTTATNIRRTLLHRDTPMAAVPRPQGGRGAITPGRPSPPPGHGRLDAPNARVRPTTTSSPFGPGAGWADGPSTSCSRRATSITTCSTEGGHGTSLSRSIRAARTSIRNCSGGIDVPASCCSRMRSAIAAARPATSAILSGPPPAPVICLSPSPLVPGADLPGFGTTDVSGKTRAEARRGRPVFAGLDRRIRAWLQ